MKYAVIVPSYNSALTQGHLQATADYHGHSLAILESRDFSLDNLNSAACNRFQMGSGDYGQSQISADKQGQPLSKSVHQSHSSITTAEPIITVAVAGHTLNGYTSSRQKDGEMKSTTASVDGASVQSYDEEADSAMQSSHGWLFVELHSN